MAEGHHRDPMEARVITVSREALRADLAEMRGDFQKDIAELEIRMTRQLGDMMARKADLIMHQALESRFNDLAREAIRRDGPSWRDAMNEIDDIRRTQDARKPLVEDVIRMREAFKSDTELRAMIREERTGWQGSQWTWVGRLITVLMFVIAAVGVTLALMSASRQPQLPQPTKTSSGEVQNAAIL